MRANFFDFCISQRISAIASKKIHLFLSKRSLRERIEELNTLIVFPLLQKRLSYEVEPMTVINVNLTFCKTITIFENILPKFGNLLNHLCEVIY